MLQGLLRARQTSWQWAGWWGAGLGLLDTLIRKYPASVGHYPNFTEEGTEARTAYINFSHLQMASKGSTMIEVIIMKKTYLYLYLCLSIINTISKRL